MTETVVSLVGEMTYEERLMAAAVELVARRAGTSTPTGTYSERNRWRPDADEWQPCCHRHRPTAQYPQAMRKHACGARHVAERWGVKEKDLKRAAAALSG